MKSLPSGDSTVHIRGRNSTLHHGRDELLQPPGLLVVLVHGHWTSLSIWSQHNSLGANLRQVTGSLSSPSIKPTIQSVYLILAIKSNLEVYKQRKQVFDSIGSDIVQHCIEQQNAMCSTPITTNISRFSRAQTQKLCSKCRKAKNVTNTDENRCCQSSKIVFSLLFCCLHSW